MAIDFMSMFPVGTPGYLQFASMLAYYRHIEELRGTGQLTHDTVTGKPVYAYSIVTFAPTIYGSLNMALQTLKLSHSTLMESIQLKYIFNGLALAFTPLTASEILEYVIKPTSSNLSRTVVFMYNAAGDLVAQFKSGRAFNR